MMCISGTAASADAAAAEYAATQDTYVDEAHITSVYGLGSELLLSGTEGAAKNI